MLGTFQTIESSDQPLRFVALVCSGEGEKIAVLTTGSQNFYYTLDGLRNLQSRLKLEDRIEVNSIIDLLNATDVRDMFIDLDAKPNLITREIDSWER